MRGFAPLVVLGLGCGGGAPGSGRPKMIVSAAASLREVVEAGRRSFRAAHPHGEIQLNFGPSGALRAQIERGAPADVFVAADPSDVEPLARAGRVAEGDRRTFARNRLVVVGRAADLRAAARVALGDPRSVPAGRHAKAWLGANGLWSPLQSRLVLGGDVRQVLDYVVRGEVDAGFVYATDARVAGLAARPAAGAPDVVYQAALLGGEGADRRARRFFEHLCSGEVRRVLAANGFLPP